MTVDEDVKKLKRPDMIVKLKQLIVKEQTNETHLATIKRDFFKDVHTWFEEADEKEREEIMVLLNKVFRKRNGKLLSYASVDEPNNYHLTLSDEEFEFCGIMFKESVKLRDNIMGKSVERVLDKVV